MHLIQSALAALAAAKARFHDLVEPEKIIAERVEACIHAFAQDFERLHEQVQDLVKRFEASSAPPAGAAPTTAEPNAGASAEAPASTTAAEASSPAEAQADAPAPATPAGS